ncbi:hypothetical protein EIP91_004090 [Steccherinum ochraceum]|uniref:Pali-domain-containing protein n=1 Tax=Steccherinum ochraceum TaxID=92696 RepID=A0A4R0RFP3_9APHY|nr:hypothetical protein EIP91_004090 [Steccherinum ochraceum]
MSARVLVHQVAPIGAPVFQLIAFILLLLVSISVPVVKSLYLFKVALGTSSSLLHSGVDWSGTFGVWGFCDSGLDVSGFQLPDQLVNALHVDGIQKLITDLLDAALGLHIVACILSFVAFILTAYFLRPSVRHPVYAIIATTFAIGFTFIVLVLDLVGFKEVSGKLDGVAHMTYGAAIWFPLVAFICLFIALICLWLVHSDSRSRRKPSSESYYDVDNRY